MAKIAKICSVKIYAAKIYVHENSVYLIIRVTYVIYITGSYSILNWSGNTTPGGGGGACSPPPPHFFIKIIILAPPRFHWPLYFKFVSPALLNHNSPKLKPW